MAQEKRLAKDVSRKIKSPVAHLSTTIFRLHNAKVGDLASRVSLAWKVM
jgi:hypothetical protein